MNVIIVQKRSQAFAVKAAFVTIIVCAALGLAFRYLNRSKPASIKVDSGSSLSSFVPFSDSLLVPVIELEISDRTLEKHWTSALAAKISGRAEVTVSYGRVDVLTDTYAIEVDYLHKFKEGIGQALHYGEVKGITPALALIYERTQNETGIDVAEKIEHIESLCSSKGIRLIILKQK